MLNLKNSMNAVSYLLGPFCRQFEWRKTFHFQSLEREEEFLAYPHIESSLLRKRRIHKKRNTWKKTPF